MSRPYALFFRTDRRIAEAVLLDSDFDEDSVEHLEHEVAVRGCLAVASPVRPADVRKRKCHP